jgi:AmmeMemoRadiSam system protein B
MPRQPAVAGTFYPADTNELTEQVDGYLVAPQETPAKQRAIACIVPHAGYIYSGHVAGAVYATLDIPDRCVLVGPRHFPHGQPLAIRLEESWQTPLGEVPIDVPLAMKLAHSFPLLRDDAVAHEREHSLEVQLPFLQRRNPRVSIVPVVLGTDRFPILEQLGKALSQIIWGAGGPVLLIASTDLNHYENSEVTRAKDELAMRQIGVLDPRGLFDVVRKENITTCGYAATVVVMIAALHLGARTAELSRYATSAEVSGDHQRVVGYAGFVIK